MCSVKPGPRPERGEAVGMGYSARVLLDSVSPGGVRLVTMEVRYPRFIHAEFMTHRMFSRNAGSSRALPIRKMIAAVRDEPAMPIYWGKNQTGMSARSEVGPQARALAEAEWLRALDNALASAERLSESDIDLHKQLVNRILEPFAWITVIVTATEWTNFFTQRCHPDAQPEIKHLADVMLAAFRSSAPSQVAAGEWHTPLVQDDERGLDLELRKRLSVARCARVSYLTHDGSRDHDKDLELFTRLVAGGANGHWSPFEHVATPLDRADETLANLRGWKQYRKFFAVENATTFPDAAAELTA
jgi:thymidylate synthase ThyX